MQGLGGQEGKAARQVKAHLPAEEAPRAHPGAIGTVDAIGQDVGQEVEIGLLKRRPGSGGLF